MMAALLLHVGRSVRADQANSQSVREIHLGRARLDTLYALTVWIKDPAQLQGNDAVLVTVNVKPNGCTRATSLPDPPPPGGAGERFPFRPCDGRSPGGRGNSAPRSAGDDSHRGVCGSGTGSDCRCAQQFLGKLPTL